MKQIRKKKSDPSDIHPHPSLAAGSRSGTAYPSRTLAPGAGAAGAPRPWREGPQRPPEDLWASPQRLRYLRSLAPEGGTSPFPGERG